MRRRGTKVCQTYKSGPRPAGDTGHVALQQIYNATPLTNMMNELITSLEMEHIQPLVKCTVFDDN